MAYSNCWFYAFPKWLKNPRRTYLVIRMSHYGWWPHVFFTESIENLDVQEFQPIYKPKGIISLWKLLYKGKERKGKGEGQYLFEEQKKK